MLFMNLRLNFKTKKKQLEIDNLNKSKKVQELELATKEQENSAKNKILTLGTVAL